MQPKEFVVLVLIAAACIDLFSRNLLNSFMISCDLVYLSYSIESIMDT